VEKRWFHGQMSGTHQSKYPAANGGLNTDRRPLDSIVSKRCSGRVDGAVWKDASVGQARCSAGRRRRRPRKRRIGLQIRLVKSSDSKK